MKIKEEYWQEYAKGKKEKLHKMKNSELMDYAAKELGLAIRQIKRDRLKNRRFS